MSCAEVSAEGVEVDGRGHKLDIPDIMDMSAVVVSRLGSTLVSLEKKLIVI